MTVSGHATISGERGLQPKGLRSAEGWDITLGTAEAAERVLDSFNELALATCVGVA